MLTRQFCEPLNPRRTPKLTQYSFNAAGNIPPANTTQYSLWFIFGFLFNHLIRRRAFAWWKKYNCE